MKLAQPQIPPKKRIVPARTWRKGGVGGIPPRPSVGFGSCRAKRGNQSSQSGFSSKKVRILTKRHRQIVNKPSVQTMDKIARALGVSIEDLLK